MILLNGYAGDMAKNYSDKGEMKRFRILAECGILNQLLKESG